MCIESRNNVLGLKTYDSFFNYKATNNIPSA